MKEIYMNGELCGNANNVEPLIAQKYITNPLLLDLENKFDLRVYMLLSSTNPIIGYYHDGYLRVSLNKFNRSSSQVMCIKLKKLLFKVVFLPLNLHELRHLV